MLKDLGAMGRDWSDKTSAASNCANWKRRPLFHTEREKLSMTKYDFRFQSKNS